jgi:Uncharacterized conserved protein
MDIRRFEKSPIGSLVSLSGTDGRSGRKYDHFAFVPDPLSREPELSGETWHEVVAAHQAIARLDQASRQVPDAKIFMAPLLSREAQSTSALEGTFVPLEDVLGIEDEDSAFTQSRDLIEVLNYRFAANNSYEMIQSGASITVGLLCQIHRRLVEGTNSESQDVGKLRSTPVVIGSPFGTVEESRFVPMPPGVGLETALNNLIEWINMPDERDPVIGAAMAHYQFETLHPFNDGNGRIGRLVIILQLMKAGLFDAPILSVSPWFERHRESYQEGLAELSATGAWDQWVRFFARGVTESAQDAVARVNRLLAVRDDSLRIVVENNPKSSTMRSIAEQMVAEPFFNASRLARRLSITGQSARVALRNMENLGLLQRVASGHEYVAMDVWDTISAPLGRVLEPRAPLRNERREQSK